MVDMSRVRDMSEPELNSALAGLGRKIKDMDEDLEASDLLLLQAARHGLESPIYVSIQADQRVAIEQRQDLVKAKRVLQSRLVDLVDLAADVGGAAAAGVAEDLQLADGLGGAADGWIDGGGFAAQPAPEDGALVEPANVGVDAGAKVQEGRAVESPSDGCAPFGAVSDGSYLGMDPEKYSEAVRAAKLPSEEGLPVGSARGVVDDDRLRYELLQYGVAWSVYGGILGAQLEL